MFKILLTTTETNLLYSVISLAIVLIAALVVLLVALKKFKNSKKDYNDLYSKMTSQMLDLKNQNEELEKQVSDMNLDKALAAEQAEKSMKELEESFRVKEEEYLKVQEKSKARIKKLNESVSAAEGTSHMYRNLLETFNQDTKRELRVLVINEIGDYREIKTLQKLSKKEAGELAKFLDIKFTKETKKDELLNLITEKLK